MLSFLHLWGNCFKCEFEYRRQNIIEHYYNHAEEQLLFKITYTKTYSKKKDVLVFIIIARNEEF